MVLPFWHGATGESADAAGGMGRRHPVPGGETVFAISPKMEHFVHSADVNDTGT